MSSVLESGVRKYSTQDYNIRFGLAQIKVNKDQYPTYESLPEKYKRCFVRLEDGGYVQREAYNLMIQFRDRTTDIMSVLHSAAKKFEPVQLAMDRATAEMMEKLRTRNGMIQE